MKYCPKCDSTLDLSEFYLRKRGPRAGEHYEKCKACMKIRGRKYYHDNRERQLPLALIRRRKYRLFAKSKIMKIKDRPCSDCGIKYPHFVMDFDHRDKASKSMEIARMVTGGWSFDKILKEVVKCDLVCANCHRIRTYGKYAEVA